MMPDDSTFGGDSPPNVMDAGPQPDLPGDPTNSHIAHKPAHHAHPEGKPPEPELQHDSGDEQPEQTQPPGPNHPDWQKAEQARLEAEIDKIVHGAEEIAEGVTEIVKEI